MVSPSHAKASSRPLWVQRISNVDGSKRSTLAPPLAALNCWFGDLGDVRHTKLVCFCCFVQFKFNVYICIPLKWHHLCKLCGPPPPTQVCLRVLLTLRLP